MNLKINRDWKLKDELVYGPFATRRKGMALGINVLAYGEKFCSFDCLYCQCGWTRQFDPKLAKEEHYIGLEEIDKVVNERFCEIKNKNEDVNSIVLSGNGEPTLHPKFDDVVTILKKARDIYFPDLLIQCLSAGTELHRTEVVRGLNAIDRPTIKLDAANESLHKKIDRPLVPFALSKLKEQLKTLDQFFLQTCFFTGPIGNVDSGDLEDWWSFVGEVRPKEVEIYSIHRVTPAKRLEAVSLDKLQEIADELYRRHGIPSQVV